MIIGYARTSTIEQTAGLAGQHRELLEAGAGFVVAEQVSSVGARPQLAAVLEQLVEGGVLMVTKPDRLARSTSDLLAIVERLQARRISLVVLSMGGQRLDTASPTGKLMLTMLGAVAEFERSLMLERQREGIAKAKSEGRYKGRKPTVAVQAAQIRDMVAAGAKPTDVARSLGVARSSVYRCLEASPAA